MRSRSGVRVIKLDTPWEENLRMIRETGFSRYPLVEDDGIRHSGPAPGCWRW
jgi:tellurite resistance protein TerC